MSKRKKLLSLVMAVLALTVVFALPAFAQDAEAEAATNTPIFDLAWVGAVIGFFLPLLTSFIKKNQWSIQAKRAIAIVTATIAGVVNVGVQSAWDFDSPAAFLQLAVFSVMDVYIAASVIYGNFWKDTGIETSLAAVGSGPNA